MINRSFDRIAKFYALAEKAFFGNTLQKARTFGLEHRESPIDRCLLIGDGNGSFAIELLRRHPSCEVFSIDISSKMLETSARRIERELKSSIANFHPIIGDAASIEFEANAYDFVGLHFVLDCFDTPTCNRLIHNSVDALRHGGTLSYADFEIPRSQPKRFLAKAFVRFLYLLFRGAAGLKIQSLPIISWPSSLTKQQEGRLIGGLLNSKTFTKTTCSNEQI